MTVDFLESWRERRGSGYVLINREAVDISDILAYLQRKVLDHLRVPMQVSAGIATFLSDLYFRIPWQWDSSAHAGFAAMTTFFEKTCVERSVLSPIPVLSDDSLPSRLEESSENASNPHRHTNSDATSQSFDE